MLSPEEKAELKEALGDGLTTVDEVREARRLLEQARRVGWTLSAADALARARAALHPVPQTPSDAAEAEAAAPPIDPSDLRLIEKLGRGSQAVVYKCRQGATGQVLAIKLLSASAARDRKARDRFLQEGRQAARLIHPYIVRVWGVFPFKDTYFIAMEYADGGSVADLLAAEGRLEPKEAVRIIRQAAVALVYAHRQGFIHRDIKPRNLLLTRDGTVKLADLGVARRNADVDAVFDEIGRTFGTPYYISPEQARGHMEVDHRSDLYSLGATFYEMLAGRPPFVAANLRQVIKMHVTEPMPDPRRFVPDLPISLCRILLRALAKAPKDRFKSADRFIRALDRADLSPPAPAPPATAAPDAPPPA